MYASIKHLLDNGIDPCGENGEFHTFVYEGPIFRSPVRHTLGETRRDGRFAFRDLLPAHVGEVTMS